MWSRNYLVQARNPVIFLVFIVAAWEYLPKALAIPKYLIPSFSEVMFSLFENAGLIAGHTLATLFGILAGFATAIFVGLSIGISITLWKGLRDTLYPFLVALYSTPRIALIPIIVIWLGYGFIPELTVVLLTSFFPVLVNTIAGFDNIPPELMELVRTMTPSRAKEILKVRLPYSLPYIFAGLKIGITQAVIGKVVAEFVIGQSGLAFVMVRAQSSLNTPVVFATLIVLILLALALYILFASAERYLLRWRSVSETVLFQ